MNVKMGYSYEAECRKCGGTFLPTGDEATQLDSETGETLYEHYTTDDGDDCGGYGPRVGAWIR